MMLVIASLLLELNGTKFETGVEQGTQVWKHFWQQACSSQKGLLEQPERLFGADATPFHSIIVPP